MKKILALLLVVVAMASCRKEKRECPSSIEKTYAYTDFTRVKAGENFEVTITKGNVFSVSASGCSNDLEEMLVTKEQNLLSFAYSKHRNDRYKVLLTITMPTLGNLILDGIATATVNGFEQQATSLKAAMNGASTGTINGLPALVQASLSGTGKLTLTGTAGDLIASLSGDARLNAYTATFNDADVYTSGSAQAKVVVQKSLAAFAEGASRIYYKGNPTSVNAETSGASKVIKE